MNDKLKPCPFCGNKEIEVDIAGQYFDIASYSSWGVVDIHCDVCKTTQKTRGLLDNCVEEAIKRWNRRVNENEKKK